MKNDVKNTINACRECQQLQPSQQQEPLQPTTNEYPMHRVGIDLFQHAGKHYVVMVDGYSGFPWVEQLHSLSTGTVIKKLNNWFRTFGYPTNIRTDGGPQFRSEFKKFCTHIGANKETSSPYYPQSNGMAEAAVKQTKHLLIKHKGNLNNFQEALLTWRNTPKSATYSPAQLMFGYAQNFGQGPPLKQVYINRADAETRKAAITATKEKSYNKHAKTLPQLPNNSPIVIQDPKSGKWDTPGTITSMRPDGRSYEILCDGNTTIRNRRDIRPDTAQ